MSNQPVVDHITQLFYDSIAPQYDLYYSDWDEAVRREAMFLRGIFEKEGFDASARILDCACGIGTQAIGLAAMGFAVTGSDLSAGALAEARRRAEARGVTLPLRQADFRALDEVFSDSFEIVIAMDNALPHMRTPADLCAAIRSITGRLRPGGLFVASIRDYDRLLAEKPTYSTPYVHKTGQGQRVLFQTWDWQGERYHFIQYIIDDGETTRLSKFECDYRAVRRQEITALLRESGCGAVRWEMPEDTGFYQPIVLARKDLFERGEAP